MNIRTGNNFYQRTVLVVDDEAINREMLGAILEKEYTVIYAANGREALEQIRAYGDLLSLVLLDLLMPEIDGYEVLRTMSANSEMRKIPVVVLTSEKSAEIKSLQLGAADFLSKPYDLPEVILARVGHSINLFENASIIHATERDSLTNLYTPGFFFEYAAIYDQHYPESQMDAIVLNFSRFHLLNELYGREHGDKVLAKIAEGIRKVVEKLGGIACRYNDDCFYLYISHDDDFKGMLDVIHLGLCELLKPQEIHLRMGIFSEVVSSISLEQRFDHAIQACNSLRAQYGSNFALYSSEMHEKEMFGVQLLQDFDTAVREKQFQVYYQPKYNITGDKPVLTSAEALIRWIHPKLGFVRPDLFIPLFEENGLVQKLDRFVWNEVAEQMKAWREKFGRPVSVSVNISRVDMNDPEMSDFIESIVKQNGIDPHDYLLEVTESAYTDNSQKIIDIVNGLREKKFRVEMDDFGSGYSSLNMLTALPIDALKIDRAFINGIAPGNKEMRMVELILDIAKFLNLTVVAEGVETKEQCDILKAAGCDIIQGFYFSKPLPAKDFEALIEKEGK